MLKFLQIGLILGFLSGSLMAKVYIEHNAFIIDPHKWEYLVNSKNLNKKLILKSRLDENLVGYFDNEMAFLDKDKNFSEKSLTEQQCSVVKKSLSENKSIVGTAEVKVFGKRRYCVLNTTINGLENSQYWFVRIFLKG